MRALDSDARRLLLALVAGLLASLVLTGCGTDEQQAEDLKEARARVQELTAEKEAGEDALKAAQQVILDITTYSHQPGEHDFEWLEKISDEELKERLQPNVADLQRAIRQGKVTAQGEIVATGTRVVDDTQVEVIAFVDQAITDGKAEDVKIEEQRVSMTMTLVDDEWLVDRLELLSGDNSGLAP